MPSMATSRRNSGNGPLRRRCFSLSDPMASGALPRAHEGRPAAGRAWQRAAAPSGWDTEGRKFDSNAQAAAAGHAPRARRAARKRCSRPAMCGSAAGLPAAKHCAQGVSARLSSSRLQAAAPHRSEEAGRRRGAVEARREQNARRLALEQLCPRLALVRGRGVGRQRAPQVNPDEHGRARRRVRHARRRQRIAHGVARGAQPPVLLFHERIQPRRVVQHRRQQQLRLHADGVKVADVPQRLVQLRVGAPQHADAHACGGWVRSEVRPRAASLTGAPTHRTSQSLC